MNAGGEPQEVANSTDANSTNTTANTTHQKNTTKIAAHPKQPPKKQLLKIVNDLAKNRTAIPVITLVLVLISVVFTTTFRRK